MASAPKSIKEIKIPAPWGHIAAKAWGDENDSIVLAFHGIFDNAGSFDGLIPLLPNSFYYVSVDLPGHGRSSHFPAHLPIHTLNYIVVYKIITTYFNRERYTIMGHSFGGQIGALFSIIYPRLVDKLILLDTIVPFPVSTDDFRTYLLEKFDGFLLTEQKLSSNKVPVYTYEEAFNKIKSNRNYGVVLSDEAATGLVQRAIEPIGNGKYRFTMDQRMKFWINPVIDFRYILEMIEKHPARYPVLIIFGSESAIQQIYMKPIVDALKEWNVTIKVVNGNHDVHNDKPQNVAPFVSSFLLNEKAKL